MADTMAIIDKKNWRSEELSYVDESIAVGDLLSDWRSYWTKNRLVERYLEPGDRLFLVTVRGEHLWLVAVYEDVRISKEGKHFVVRTEQENAVPVIDITTLRKKFRFHTGNGLTLSPGKLGNSLQAPRKLTDHDVGLLEGKIRKAGASIAPSRRLSGEAEATEGRKMTKELTIYERDPALAMECIRRDEYTCRFCGFSVDAKRFPTLFKRIRARVVHAHHVRPLSSGKRKTKVSDLLTLCPTCHAVVHAIAQVQGSEVVALTLLKKHYRP